MPSRPQGVGSPRESCAEQFLACVLRVTCSYLPPNSSWAESTFAASFLLLIWLTVSHFPVSLLILVFELHKDVWWLSHLFNQGRDQGRQGRSVLHFNPLYFPEVLLFLQYELLIFSRLVCFVQPSVSPELGVPSCLGENLLLHSKTI